MRRILREAPIVSGALVIVNVIVFLACIFTGGLLYDLGGVDRVGIVVRHEYGRLFWALFLHNDTAHLFNNMIILFFLGAMLEKEAGHIGLLMIYFFSGIGGNVASLLHKIAEGSNALSIGASGAVFGLDGLMLAYVLLSRKFRDTVSTQRVLIMIALSLYNGFVGDNIDNAAHIGGLMAGLLAGIVFILVQNIFKKKDRQEVQF